MEKLIQELNRFQPSCEQEEVEKAMFLHIAKTIPNSLTRDSLLGHFTVSAWVMNKSKTHVLCAYHNIYKNWGWLGGHCDGDDDLARVISKEIEEESGIREFTLYKEGVFTLEAVPVFSHIKKGKHVPSHIHLNFTYVFIADENSATRIAENENSAVGWKEFDELIEITDEEHMKPIYKKIVNKIRRS